MSKQNKKTEFVVETGNWKAYVNHACENTEVENYDFIEAATIALECLFSPNGELGEHCELFSLIDENGEDYFLTTYSGKLSEVPEVLFGVLTACYLKSDIDKPEKKWFLLTSSLFANASQPYNVETALEIEKNWSKEVADFKSKEAQLRKILDKIEPDDVPKKPKKVTKKIKKKGKKKPDKE